MLPATAWVLLSWCLTVCGAIGKEQTLLLRVDAKKCPFGVGGDEGCLLRWIQSQRIALTWLGTFSQQQIYSRICNKDEGCSSVDKTISVSSR